MRHYLSSILLVVLAAGGLDAGEPAARADSGRVAQDVHCSVVDSQSTLSSLGIDFGAAELLRFAELDLSDDQKRQALGVVRELRPMIDRLCDRLTQALKMDESTPQMQRGKKGELELVIAEFKQLQEQIMTGLHAVVTAEQGLELQAIKQRERQLAERRQAG